MFQLILKYTLFLLLSHYNYSLWAQAELSWDALGDVTFEHESLDDTDTYWLVPTFGRVIQLYEGWDVVLEGYLVLNDLEENLSVLSKFPFASCFFCGGAGPESIVEINFKNKEKGLSIDQRVKIRGTFMLNADDIEHLNYRIVDAEIYK